MTAGPTTPESLKLSTTIGLLTSVVHVVRALPLEDLRELARELERTESLAPVLEPTWFRSEMGNLAVLREVNLELIKFRLKLAELAEKHGGEHGRT